MKRKDTNHLFQEEKNENIFEEEKNHFIKNSINLSFNDFQVSNNEFKNNNNNNNNNNDDNQKNHIFNLEENSKNNKDCQNIEIKEDNVNHIEIDLGNNFEISSFKENSIFAFDLNNTKLNIDYGFKTNETNSKILTIDSNETISSLNFKNIDETMNISFNNINCSNSNKESESCLSEANNPFSLNQDGHVGEMFVVENGDSLIEGKTDLSYEITLAFNEKYLDFDNIPDRIPLVSYGIQGYGNAFKIELRTEEDGEFKIHLQSGNETESLGNLNPDLLFDGNVHKIGVSFNSEGEVSYTIDCEEIGTDTFEGNKDWSVPADGVLVIGQEMENLGTHFDPETEYISADISGFEFSSQGTSLASFDFDNINENGIIKSTSGEKRNILFVEDVEYDTIVDNNTASDEEVLSNMLNNYISENNLEENSISNFQIFNTEYSSTSFDNINNLQVDDIITEY